MTDCFKNTCALIFFDCCREEITAQEMGLRNKDAKLFKAKTLARGNTKVNERKAAF